MKRREGKPRTKNGVPVEPRTCLFCGKTFLSTGPGNRICVKCQHNVARREPPRAGTDRRRKYSELGDI